MDNTFNENVSNAESLRRYTLGTVILAVFFINPTLPAWLTLIALYPLFTALLKWDPFNAFFEHSINRKLTIKHTPAPSIRSAKMG